MICDVCLVQSFYQPILNILHVKNHDKLLLKKLTDCSTSELHRRILTRKCHAKLKCCIRTFKQATHLLQHNEMVQKEVD